LRELHPFFHRYSNDNYLLTAHGKPFLSLLIHCEVFSVSRIFSPPKKDKIKMLLLV
jgi:hypothetical protein